MLLFFSGFSDTTKPFLELPLEVQLIKKKKRKKIETSVCLAVFLLYCNTPNGPQGSQVEKHCYTVEEVFCVC